jgi:hypothetical protein
MNLRFSAHIIRERDEKIFNSSFDFYFESTSYVEIG